MQRLVSALCFGMALLLSAVTFVVLNSTDYQKPQPQPTEVVLDFNAIPVYNCMKSPECSKSETVPERHNDRLFRVRSGVQLKFDPDHA
jgi:hypothetical protein